MKYFNVFNREKTDKEIEDFLEIFYKNSYDSNIKRGVYLYGKHGIGKTAYIENILKNNNYEMLRFNASDFSKKDLLTTLSSECMGDTCVLSSFLNAPKKKVIVIDDLISIHVNDKTTVGKFIRMIRPKKTKRQKKEEISYVPFIFINSCYTDKKLKELMKVTECLYLNEPTTTEIENYISQYMEYHDKDKTNLNIPDILENVNNNLHVTQNIIQYFIEHGKKFENIINTEIDNDYSYVNIKDVVYKLLQTPIDISDHYYYLHETDRTSISLLLHENMIDHIECKLNQDNTSESNLNVIESYAIILNELCFTDYIDRVTFQKQVWILNELNSINKNVRILNKFHKLIESSSISHIKKEPRFTKVLTKYSTEYNNDVFLMEMTQKLQIDVKDLIGLFIYYKAVNIDVPYDEYNAFDISTLDVKRMIRFVNVLLEP